jgi:hypothetical protein
MFQNAFSRKLSPLGFNFFLMLVVDLLHEFELGVWKALFIHLLRILHAANKTSISELNRRYVKFIVNNEYITTHAMLEAIGRYPLLAETPLDGFQLTSLK